MDAKKRCVRVVVHARHARLHGFRLPPSARQVVQAQAQEKWLRFAHVFEHFLGRISGMFSACLSLSLSVLISGQARAGADFLKSLGV